MQRRTGFWVGPCMRCMLLTCCRAPLCRWAALHIGQGKGRLREGLDQRTHCCLDPTILPSPHRGQQKRQQRVRLHGKKTHVHQQVSEPVSIDSGLRGLHYSTKNSQVDVPALALKPCRGGGFQNLSSARTSIWLFLAA